MVALSLSLSIYSAKPRRSCRSSRGCAPAGSPPRTSSSTPCQARQAPAAPPSPRTLFCEVGNGIGTYGVASHRHSNRAWPRRWVRAPPHPSSPSPAASCPCRTAFSRLSTCPARRARTWTPCATARSPVRGEQFVYRKLCTAAKSRRAAADPPRAWEELLRYGGGGRPGARASDYRRWY
jgi:hypothetical protein